MFLCRAVLLLYLLNTSVWKTGGQRTITWTSISCRYNSVYVGNASCAIVQPQNLSINVEIDYLHDICEDFGYLDVQMPQAQKTGFVHLLNYKVKVSDFISKAVKNNFFKLFYQSVEKFSNLPNKCPMATNTHLDFRNFTYPAEQMPIFVPEMNFLTLLKLTRPNEDFVGEIILKGRLECKERKGFGCSAGVRRG